MKIPLIEQFDWKENFLRAKDKKINKVLDEAFTKFCHVVVFMSLEWPHLVSQHITRGEILERVLS